MVAHHLHLKGTPLLFLIPAWGAGGSLPLGLPASVTTMKQEWQGDVPSLAAQSGNPNVARAGRIQMVLLPLSQQPLPMGTDRQAGNECGRLSQALGTTAPAPGPPI